MKKIYWEWYIIIVMAAMFVMTGCGEFNNLPAHGKALSVAWHTSAAAEKLMDTYEGVFDVVDIDGKKWLTKKVKPVLIKLERVCIDLNSAALVYSNTQERPGDWASLLADAGDLIDEAYKLFNELIKDKGLSQELVEVI